VQKKTLIVIAIIVLGGIGWYLFRPERAFISERVNESLPGVQTVASQSNVLATGMFHDGAHKTSGTAGILRLEDGKRILRLTGFQTSNGPDVRVYLVAAPDALDNATVKSAGFIDLGALKGNIGDQNYDLAADVDLNKYRAVTVWCRRFSVNFGTAPLNQGSTPTMTASQTLRSSGQFESGAHQTAGLAMIHELPDGKRFLRFTEFETSNGPDVQVYLVAASGSDVTTAVKKGSFVNVGALKGNIGDQNYEIPANLDLGKYDGVSVWCRRFGVNFGMAALKPADQAAAAMMR
jgi:hypothetical protein